MNKAVFFDRDGVLNLAVVENGKCYPPKDADSLVIAPGAQVCLERLKKDGYLCLCVTNQPDLARGTRTLANIEAMNDKVLRALPLDDLSVCLHDNADNCNCRKPKPGLLLEAAAKLNIDLAASWMVGDRKSDIEAGRAAGCRTIFLDCGYDRPEKILPTAACDNIAAVADIILID